LLSTWRTPESEITSLVGRLQRLTVCLWASECPASVMTKSRWQNRNCFLDTVPTVGSLRATLMSGSSPALPPVATLADVDWKVRYLTRQHLRPPRRQGFRHPRGATGCFR